MPPPSTEHCEQTEDSLLLSAFSAAGRTTAFGADPQPQFCPRNRTRRFLQ